ncbi:conserved hypothetical protein [Ricinus communis]|uniref:Uncharacterized protein n=1 Tax=Ricinus communis TaxID=3988 RepID=B9RK40_RICCO|nr:conserved hypothetical protein [Ricinus communis]
MEAVFVGNVIPINLRVLTRYGCIKGNGSREDVPSATVQLRMTKKKFETILLMNVRPHLTLKGYYGSRF